MRESADVGEVTELTGALPCMTLHCIAFALHRTAFALLGLALHCIAFAFAFPFAFAFASASACAFAFALLCVALLCIAYSQT